jgi:hypothetical protein
MERLKKQILYRPQSASNIPPKTKPEESEQEIQKEESTKVDVGIDGKKLAEWIKSASLINKSALCSNSGVDRANLDKYLLKGEIPSQHIKPLVLILKKYGYA